MRISAWSSDVCSSDLGVVDPAELDALAALHEDVGDLVRVDLPLLEEIVERPHRWLGHGHHRAGLDADAAGAGVPVLAEAVRDRGDRKGVVWGKRVGGRVDYGGGGNIKQTNKQT